MQLGIVGGYSAGHIFCPVKQTWIPKKSENFLTS